MAALKNHPGLWLRDDAAAAINALEDKYGPIVINSAGRTVAEQNSLIRRWDQGGKYNRPPYLYEPARPAERSNHVANGGIAVDVYNYTSDRAKLNEFGFQWYGPSDKVHYTFTGWSGNNPAADEATRQRQNFLKSRGWNLQVDGVEGPVTRQAYREYQEYLKNRGWYAGEIDGVWGNGTQAAHEKFWNELNTAQPPAGGSAVPSALRWYGIQAMLKGTGRYSGKVDNIPGDGTIRAFQDFLNDSGYGAGSVDGKWGANTGKAAQRWLKARWGYGGAIDNDFGGGTLSAWQRAETANWNAYR